jgi:hypothetical protein
MSHDRWEVRVVKWFTLSAADARPDSGHIGMSDLGRTSATTDANAAKAAPRPSGHPT